MHHLVEFNLRYPLKYYVIVPEVSKTNISK